MPRVTVNRDTSAVTPLPTPEPAPDLAEHEPLPDIALTHQQADAPPVVVPAPPVPPVQQIVRQIQTVLIDVPLCANPPGLDGTPSFTKAHVNLQLIRSRSVTARHLLHRLWWGLKEKGDRSEARQRPQGLQPRRRRRVADRATGRTGVAGAERPASPGRDDDAFHFPRPDRGSGARLCSDRPA